MKRTNFIQIKKAIYKYAIDAHPIVSQEYRRYLENLALGQHVYGKVKKIANLNWNYRICKKPFDESLRQLQMPEMACTKLPSPKQLAQALSKYDVISFDIFDTLIFRAVEKPKDVFRLLEGTYQCMGFAKKRIQAEQEARKEKAEVTIYDIYRKLAIETGILPQEGIRREICMEHKVCYANPYMYTVYQLLLKKGKKLIAVSDMYLPGKQIEELLKKCGYREFFQIFVSCDYGKGKGDGSLQKIAQAQTGMQLSYIHIGDHVYADIQGSKKAGWETFHYQNIQSQGAAYRRKEMTSLAASFYKGLVNRKMHCGMSRINACYEYGYVYGGLLAYGYCQYLEQLAHTKQIDQFLFTARDGYLLHRIYKKMFGNVDCAYVPFSRFAAYQLTMESSWREFLACCVRPRTCENPQKTVSQVMQICDIEWMREYLPAYGISEQMKFDETVYLKIERLFAEHTAQAAEQYRETKEAAEIYFRKIIGEHKKICVVDVGWQGTSIIACKHFLEETCHMDLTVCGALMAANENEASEINLDTDKVHTYLFSVQKNKDLLQKHFGKEQERDYRNLLVEIMFTQDQPTFLKFLRNSAGEVECLYGPDEENSRMIHSIQAGIIDFCKDYAPYAKAFQGWLTVSGREAYLPLDALAEAKEYCIKFLGGYRINKYAGMYDQNMKSRTFKQIVTGR